MCLDLYQKINSYENQKYFESFILYSVATVLAGVKPSCTINFKRNSKDDYANWNKYGETILASIKLEYIKLRDDGKSMIILVYKKSLIRKQLINHKINAFLVKLGYSNELDVDGYLNTLKKRYEKYNCPHELGIFLGIPIEDVIDFMECNEDKCIACGYWKVYNNYSSAMRTFKIYDKVKDITAKQIINEVDLGLIANNLRNIFVK